jgi:hypothetical protein
MLYALLQNTMQEAIWDAAKAEDKTLLEQCLVNATTEDFKFRKTDEVTCR